MQARELLNEYDLGLPVPIASLEERRRGVPTEVWARLERVKETLVTQLGLHLHEVRLFGSYARNQFDDESDVDVLILVESLLPGERQRVVDAVLALTGWGVFLSPLVLTVAEFDALRAREKLIAQDIDREGITV